MPSIGTVENRAEVDDFSRLGRLHDRCHRLEARTYLNLARDGLGRIKIGRCQERSESHFLKDLDRLIEGGVTLAE